MVAEPPVSVAPALHVPSLAPQLRSVRESMSTLPPALISPATVSAAGGGDARKRNFDTVAWIFWCALEAEPVFVGTQPTVTTFRSFGLTPLVTVTNASPICVPLTMIGMPALPSYG